MPLRHLRQLLTSVGPIAERFEAAGWKLYVVGGAVREAWLDRTIADGDDIDLTTDARPDDSVAVLDGWADAIWTTGSEFGTIGCQKDGREFEITTHRAESYGPHSRKPMVSFADAVDVDLSRRDFTVNAMALELPGGELHDPFGGADDLRAKRLRTPLGPHLSFSDDPLRMLRAARFAAGYDLEPSEDLLGAIARMRARLEIVSVERCQAEIEKLLAIDDPGRGLDLLVETGLAEHVLPGLAELSGWSRAALRAELAVLPVGRLRLAALATAIAPGREEQMLRDLRYPNHDAQAVARIAAAVETLPTGDAPAASLRRWLAAAGSHRPAALVLARARAEAVGRRPESVDELEAALADLAEREDLDDLGPPVDGQRVMTRLGVGPGPLVGEALAHLTEHRLEHGPITPEQADVLLDAWWRSRAGG